MFDRDFNNQHTSKLTFLSKRKIEGNLLIYYSTLLRKLQTKNREETPTIFTTYMYIKERLYVEIAKRKKAA